jgi:tetratricopeptide (TPR) repeat protein
MIQMQKQLKTNAPPASKVPSPPNKDQCMICGSNISGDSGTCEDCKKKRRWDISSLTTPLYTLAVMALSLSFLILINHEEILSTFEIDLKGREDVGYLFLILSILTAMIFSWQRRRALSSADAYRSVFPALAIMLIPIPIALLSLEPASIAALISTLVIFPVSLGVLYFFRKETKDMGLVPFALITTGSILVLFGMIFSLRDIELTGVMWFLSGKHVVVMGTFLLLIGSYISISKISIISKSIAPSIFFSLSTISFLVLVFLGVGSNERSQILNLMMVIPFLLLMMSTGSFLAEIVNDLRVTNTNSEMEESLNRAVDLEKKKRIFYSLQQMDRAINSNPVNGFGRSADHANVIFTMEGPGILEDFTFTPSEYEISLNEKAKILSSQGRFPEAAKEYQEAIKRNPDFLESYQNLAMLLSSIPGKKKEGVKHIDYILGSKEMYLNRWMRHGVPTRYVYWMADSMVLYREMLHKKSDLLYRLSKEGDVWAYYSLVRY